MQPLKLIETDAGSFSLLLNAGETQVDRTIEELGHEAGGYFWAGIAQLLLKVEAKQLEGRFGLDPEAGMFCAYGKDKAALEQLGELMAAIANDESELRAIVDRATELGFEFDD